MAESVCPWKIERNKNNGLSVLQWQTYASPHTLLDVMAPSIWFICLKPHSAWPTENAASLDIGSRL